VHTACRELLEGARESRSRRWVINNPRGIQHQYHEVLKIGEDITQMARIGLNWPESSQLSRSGLPPNTGRRFRFPWLTGNANRMIPRSSTHGFDWRRACRPGACRRQFSIAFPGSFAMLVALPPPAQKETSQRSGQGLRLSCWNSPLSRNPSTDVCAACFFLSPVDLR
jgi:hypothetical protein